MKSLFKHAIPPLVGLLLGSASLSRADTISYIVTLNTSPLVGHAAAPFSLDFQFTDGQGTGDSNNTIALSNFAFGSGGSATGIPSLTNGASGSLGTAVALIDSAFFNEFTQGFTPGSQLSFLLQFTNNVDPGPTPDEFSFAILDNSGFEIPTLNFASALIVIDIDSASPTVQTFSTDPNVSPFGGGGPIDMAAAQVTPVTSAVPEPSSAILLSTSLVLLSFVRRAREKISDPVREPHGVDKVEMPKPPGSIQIHAVQRGARNPLK